MYALVCECTKKNIFFTFIKFEEIEQNHHLRLERTGWIIYPWCMQFCMGLKGTLIDMPTYTSIYSSILGQFFYKPQFHPKLSIIIS